MSENRELVVGSSFDSDAGQQEDEADLEEIDELDDSAQTNVYMMKEDGEDYRVWRWKIEKWSSYQKSAGRRTYSDEFTVGGHPWRVMLFPRGNNSSCLGVYIDVPDGKKQTKPWSRFARIQLGVVNRKDYRKSVHNETSKRFSTGETDWGFRELIPFARLTEEEGFIQNDTLTIEITVSVEKTNWWTKEESPSREEIGFVGLRNQGATCYMNSLLQTLHHLAAFRRAVYEMPTEQDKDPEHCIPLALQRVCFNLQFGSLAVSTKQLTKSFGWDSFESFMQHDVQELARVLLDNLDSKMKDTPSEGTIDRLFKGKTRSYITCVNVDYSSSREEPYYDVQLNVKDCPTLYDSFRNYVEVEMLEGDNKYQAEGFGLQDAKKGVIFREFPPVLMLHLKRFNYDFVQDRMYKVNDRLEFQETLDLSDFVEDISDHAHTTFRLYSVLVHSGDVHGGHYYAFIRPGMGDEWFKFDDDHVSKATREEALDQNFGGGSLRKSKLGGMAKARRFQDTFLRRHSNAYMLVYIRESEVEAVLRAVDKDEIPEHLITRFEDEAHKEEQRRKDKEEAHLYCHIHVAMQEDLAKHEGFELIKFDTVPAMKVLKTATLAELKDMLAKERGIPVAHMQLWTWTSRQNKTYRPDSVLPQDSSKKTLESLFRLSPYVADRVQLFCRVANPARPLRSDEAFVFFKAYDPHEMSIRCVASDVVPLSKKMGDLSEALCKHAGWEADTELLFFEEIRSSRVDPIPATQVLKDAELQTGDIVVFQRALPDEEAREVRFPTAKTYLQYLFERVEVRFVPLEKPQDEGMKLELRKPMKFDEVVVALAERLEGVDPEYIRLTGHSTYADAPRRDPLTSKSGSLQDMLTQGTLINSVLYYETLTMPLKEMETKKLCRVRFFDVDTFEYEKLEIFVTKTAKIADVLEEVKKRVTLKHTGELRLMEVYSNKIQKVFSPSDNVTGMYDYSTVFFRVEEITEEEKNPPEGARIVALFHGQKEFSTVYAHGTPFFVVVTEETTAGHIRKLVQERLKASDEDVAKWKISTVQFSQTTSYLDDEALIIPALRKAERVPGRQVSILVERKDMDPKSSSSSLYPNSRFAEREIRIYH